MKLSKLFDNPCNVHFVRSRMDMPRIEIAQKFIDALVEEGKIIEAYKGYYRLKREGEVVGFGKQLTSATLNSQPQTTDIQLWRGPNRHGYTNIQARTIPQETGGHIT